MKRCKQIFLSAVCLFAVMSFAIGSTGAVTISDRAGGAIYWGGKYVNIKPSSYSDVIGRRSAVDRTEVTMNNDVVTVKITGPYFFNYVHNLKRTQEAPPGDLYMSSQGWKVSGTPPYNKDIFEASEGWDYVVSFENKKVYKLKFSEIAMTSALPYVSKYRAQQAWRGGYGEAVDDAGVSLTDRGLSFTFSVRNIALRSDIGFHWTMKCGNDIIEGSALIPPIAMASPSADPAFIEVANGDPADPFGAEEIIPASVPIPAAASAPQGELTASASPGGAGGWSFPPALAAAAFPFLYSGSDDGHPILTSSPIGPTPPPNIEPYNSVPEPSAVFLLLTSLFTILARRRHLKQPHKSLLFLI